MRRRNAVSLRLISLGLPLLLAAGARAQTVRVKDVARLEGVRDNQLVGYGLVVGLDGTGDSKQTVFTTQSMANLLSRFGIETSAAQLKVKNIAAVMLTADLPPFARSGDKIDVQVSSVGDARSLQGGVLLQTPLLGADQETYAVAQGPISLGGFVAGGGGAAVAKNHPTSGRIPNGALVEKEVPMTVADSDHLTFSLRQPDFSAATKVAEAIRQATGATATAEDAGRVRVVIPAEYRGNVVAFVSRVGEATTTAEPVSKVVINERTGTIVIGGAVRLSPVAVAHGNLSVSVTTDFNVSQPAPKSKGSTTVTPTQNTSVTEETAATFMLKGENTLEDLIEALNAIKATPRDIIAILQAIKEAGGLQGELEIL